MKTTSTHRRINFLVKEIDLGDRKVKAKVADNFLKRFWGLSLQKKGKMLFVFPRLQRPGIDMMLLSVPLQLIFLDEEKKVVDVQKAKPWNFNPKSWKIYRPKKPSKYLLESTEFLNIQEGDQIKFET